MQIIHWEIGSLSACFNHTQVLFSVVSEYFGDALASFYQQVGPAGATSHWLRLWAWAWEEPLLVPQGQARQRPPRTWAGVLGNTL